MFIYIRAFDAGTTQTHAIEVDQACSIDTVCNTISNTQWDMATAQCSRCVVSRLPKMTHHQRRSVLRQTFQIAHITGIRTHSVSSLTMIWARSPTSKISKLHTLTKSYTRPAPPLWTKQPTAKAFPPNRHSSRFDEDPRNGRIGSMRIPGMEE